MKRKFLCEENRRGTAMCLAVPHYQYTGQRTFLTDESFGKQTNFKKNNRIVDNHTRLCYSYTKCIREKRKFSETPIK